MPDPGWLMRRMGKTWVILGVLLQLATLGYGPYPVAGLVISALAMVLLVSGIVLWRSGVVLRPDVPVKQRDDWA